MKKLREPISTGKYDEDVAKYIPGLLELKFQGMLEDIDTSEKVAHSSYTDMEELDFQILLTDNYYINPNSIHICFPKKLKKKTMRLLILMLIWWQWTVFLHILSKKLAWASMVATFSPYKIFQYSVGMLKHLPKDV